MSYYYVDDIQQSQPHPHPEPAEIQQSSLVPPLIKSNSLEGRRKRKLSNVEDLLLQRALDSMDSVAQKRERLSDRERMLDRERILDRERVLDRERFSDRERASDRERFLDRERTSDRYDIFGVYVASEMREIADPEWFRWAKQKIQAVLCEAQAGTAPYQSCDISGGGGGGGGGGRDRHSPPHPPHISEPNHVSRRERSRGSTGARVEVNTVPYANSADCLQLHTGYVHQSSSIRHAE